mmetsp:Transcript_58429/g.66648  ORF Transcript_58429/g.66648 Transcript_58429/m.66648 type:complete len:272 (+) Transcript_58429:57-872(+)
MRRSNNRSNRPSQRCTSMLNQRQHADLCEIYMKNCPPLAKENTMRESSPNRNRTAFDKWLKGRVVGLTTQNFLQQAILKVKNQKIGSRSVETSVLGASHKSQPRTLVLKLNDKVTSKKMSSTSPTSLDGVYQETIIMGQPDYDFLFRNIAHALQPSAEFSVLVVIPHKRCNIISRDLLLHGYGSNEIHDGIKKYASRQCLDIHRIEDKNAILSKGVWMEIYQRMLPEETKWKSILQSKHFPDVEDSIPSFLASRLDCTIAVVRGKQSNMAR